MPWSKSWKPIWTRNKPSCSIKVKAGASDFPELPLSVFAAHSRQTDTAKPAEQSAGFGCNLTLTPHRQRMLHNHNSGTG
jgi:hypothetical protein